VGRSYRSIILVALLCLVAYANALGDGFVYDDFDLIVNNDWLGEGSLLEAFRLGYWETSRGGSFYYRPMVSLSYKLDHAIWSKEPFGYHLFNLGLHLVTSLIVLALASRWLSSRGAGLAAASIFAVHPIHTQSVTWIAGRTDLLAAFFFLAALLLQQLAFDAAVPGLKARSDSSLRPDSRKPALPNFLQGLSLAALAGALLSKEMAVTYPAILALHAWYMTRCLAGSTHHKTEPFFARWWRPLGAATAVVGATLVLRLGVVGHLAGFADDPHAWWVSADGLASRVMAIPEIVVFYLRRMIVPVWIAFESGIRPVTSVLEPAMIVSLGGLAALCLLGFRLRRRDPAVPFGILFFAVTLLPVMNIFPIFESAMEHFAYLPSVGIVVAMTALGRSMISHPGARITAACVVVLLLGGRTVLRNQDWKDEETFWKVTVQDSPSARAYNNLGLHLWQEGRLDEAEAALQSVLNLKPELPSSHSNLGVVLSGQGRSEEAVRLFNNTLLLDPVNADALFNLALARELNPSGRRYGQGFPAAEAIATYKRLVQAHPDHAEGWLNLGVIYEEIKQPDEAILAYENCSRAAPSYSSPVLYKADLLWARGDRRLAATAYRRYLQLVPAGEGAPRAQARSGL
jgi:Flp pilus assembly protein TadD